MQHHASYASNVVPTLVFVTSWFVIGAAIFGTLHWLFRSQQQPFWRKDIRVDLCYWIIGPLLYGYVALILRSWAVDYAHLDRITEHIGRSLADQPILLQAAIILFITDLFQYWAHRLFHRNPLWRFHSIHHGPTRIDWFTSVRMHPINFILYSTLINVVISLAGFSPRALIALLPFNTFYGFLVHANLNWTFGPFRYLFASPVFHRWHHTYADQGGERNFAPTFPFLDLLFGTFYMPKDRWPSDFGIDGRAMPDHLLGQLWYPFARRRQLDDTDRPPVHVAVASRNES
ncbi:MAG TPA: sterol desaturase family protein [Acetobacteraceae bacterium]|nr:sterol desaturase family protein [Acetobacteraceae bacterium]